MKRLKGWRFPLSKVNDPQLGEVHKLYFSDSMLDIIAIIDGEDKCCDFDVNTIPNNYCSVVLPEGCLLIAKLRGADLAELPAEILLVANHYDMTREQSMLFPPCHKGDETQKFAFGSYYVAKSDHGASDDEDDNIKNSKWRTVFNSQSELCFDINLLESALES